MKENKRERLSALVRSDKLDITKAVTEEIVRTQNELGDSQFGCRKK